jgi:type IV pilus assembly protein PilF
LLWLSRVAPLLLLAGLTACGSPAVDNGPPTPSDQTSAQKRAQTRLELASGYFSRGQNDAALDELKQAMAAQPDNPDAYNLRGLIYANMGDPALAEASFKRTLELAPHDGDAMHNYGWFLCQQKRYAEAQAEFRQALAQPQYRAQVRTLLASGVCEANAQHWKEAEQTLLKAYELDPRSPVTAANLSEVLYHEGQYERARFYIGRVNGNPEQRNAQTLWLAARIEHKLGNAAAMDEFGRLLHEKYPQSPETLAFDQRHFDD